jgi:hypothetical protein
MPTVFGHTRALRAVIGATVKDVHGAALGEITDLLSDERGTKILFAIVTHAGKAHPVPWDSLRYQETEQVYLATADEVAEPVGPIDEFEFDALDSDQPGYWATV